MLLFHKLNWSDNIAPNYMQRNNDPKSIYPDLNFLVLRVVFLTYIQNINFSSK